jgi:hypothetical protein
MSNSPSSENIWVSQHVVSHLLKVSPELSGDLGPTGRAILLHYAIMADSVSLVTWSDHATLSRRSGFKLTAIKDAVKALKQLGYLVPDGFERKGIERFKIALPGLIPFVRTPSSTPSKSYSRSAPAPARPTATVHKPNPLWESAKLRS